MKKLLLGLTAVASLAAAVPAFAQPVDAREHNQAVRVEQGVRSGALSRHEAVRLHAREVKLHRTEARMRARNGGHLSHLQRAKLARMENRDSRAIARLKHNDVRRY